MNVKLKSIIASLDLNKVTFKNTKIEPLTRINFFYGGNGAGKSTIASSILDCNRDEVTFQDWCVPEDYEIVLFNRDFINRNFKSSQEIPGILTINETNVRLNSQLKDAKEQLFLTKTKISELEESISVLNIEKEKLKSTVIENVWNITKTARSTLTKALGAARRTKKGFFEYIYKHKTTSNVDIEALEQRSEIAFDKNICKYDKLELVYNPSIIDDIADSSLLSRAIISASNSNFSLFIAKINALDWVREGYSKFQGRVNSTCPYCQQQLPEDFNNMLRECFDEQYREDIEQIEHLCLSYSDLSDRTLRQLKSNLNCNSPGFNKTDYHKLFTNLESSIQLNRVLLERKLNQPSLIICKDEWQNTTHLIKEINALILSCNEKIEKNNRITENQKEAQEEIRQDAWNYSRFLCNESIVNYERMSSEIHTKIDKLNRELKKQRGRESELESKIKNYYKYGVNITQTVESINKFLKESGFQGFYLAAHTEGVGTYKLVREDGSIAHNLSERELNFIAFLYFYHSIVGNGVLYMASDKQTTTKLEDYIVNKDKIVIIDDPVSSLDSASLFLVSSLVRRLINSCYCRHANFEKLKGELLVDHNSIEQIFVLTHNAYFYNEVSNGFIDDYKGVSFFLVKKNGNISTVESCIRDSNEIGRKENYSPVRNGYAACWDELKLLYKKDGSSIEIKNVSRRILEQYFLQLCGYDGISLRDVVIGHVNDTELAGTLEASVIDSLLRFISYRDTLLEQSMQIENDGLNLDVHKKAFREIFKIMGQEQHYKMMMGI